MERERRGAARRKVARRRLYPERPILSRNGRREVGRRSLSIVPDCCIQPTCDPETAWSADPWRRCSRSHACAPGCSRRELTRCRQAQTSPRGSPQNLSKVRRAEVTGQIVAWPTSGLMSSQAEPLGDRVSQCFGSPSIRDTSAGCFILRPRGQRPDQAHHQQPASTSSTSGLQGGFHPRSSSARLVGSRV